MNYKVFLLGLSKCLTEDPSSTRSLQIANYLLSLGIMDIDKTLLIYTLSDRLWREQRSPALLYELLSFMRNLGRRECFTPEQLEVAKIMIKWADGAKGEKSDCFGEIKDKDGNPVYLFKNADLLKQSFFDIKVE